MLWCNDMIAVNEETLKEITSIIVQEVHPEAVLVFGSYARGNVRPDSDLDLLVIETNPFGPGQDRRQEIVRLLRVLMGFGIAKDILVYSRHEVDRWRHARNHIIATALKEGRVLYGKP